MNELSNQAVDNTGLDYKNQNGMLYTRITDFTNSWHLSVDDLGSFSLQQVGDADGGEMFGSFAGVIGTDAQNRVMWYYPGQMNDLGVSRFRIGATTAIPSNGVLVALVQVGSPKAVAAMDTQGNLAYLVACNYNGNTNKVFLSSDTVNGPRKLEDESLQNTVTGGVTRDCAPMALYVETGTTNAGD